MSDNNEVTMKKDESPKRTGTAIARLENALIVDGGKTIETDFNAPKRIGLIIAFLVFGVFGLWSALMPISGAAHAPGQVSPKSFKKPIQHLEGGIIKEVLVHEGDRVGAGDVLLIMDNTQSQSQLGILDSQYKSRLAQEARLIAERDKLAAVAYPPTLAADDPVAQTEMRAQTQIFEANRTTIAGEIAVLNQRIEQLQSQAKGLESVRKSKLELASSFEAELKDFESLLKEGFADKTQLRNLERNFAATSGEAAQLAANIASTNIQIGETKLEVLQLQNRRQSEIASQLSTVQTELKDIGERMIALKDIVGRTEVRTYDPGIVNNLKVHSPGTVVPPGTVIAEIVPEKDELVVDARISPMDIDRVFVGQEAKIRMSSLNTRKVPTLYGVVTTLSADIVTDQSGASYYHARLELAPESLVDLNGEQLVPGMPAEVYIQTGSRTFLQYLMKPLSDSMATSLRED